MTMLCSMAYQSVHQNCVQLEQNVHKRGNSQIVILRLDGWPLEIKCLKNFTEDGKMTAWAVYSVKYDIRIIVRIMAKTYNENETNILIEYFLLHYPTKGNAKKAIFTIT